MRISWWFALSIGSVCVAAAVLLAHYLSLPDSFPVHWNAAGEADSYIDKSVPVVILHVAFAPALVLFLGCLSMLMLKVSGSGERSILMRELMAPTIAKFVFFLCFALSFGMAGVLLFERGFGFISGVLILAVVYVVIKGVKTKKALDAAHPSQG